MLRTKLFHSDIFKYIITNRDVVRNKVFEQFFLTCIGFTFIYYSAKTFTITECFRIDILYWFRYCYYLKIRAMFKGIFSETLYRIRYINWSYILELIFSSKLICVGGFKEYGSAKKENVKSQAWQKAFKCLEIGHYKFFKML